MHRVKGKKRARERHKNTHTHSEKDIGEPILRDAE